METVMCIVLTIVLAAMGTGSIYIFYAFFRDDRRSERERKMNK